MDLSVSISNPEMDVDFVQLFEAIALNSSEAGADLVEIPGSVVVINAEPGADHAQLINSALADPLVVKVVLGEGVFNLTSPIVIPSNKTLEGAGRDLTILRADGENFTRPGAGEEDGLVNSVRGSENIAVHNLTIDANKLMPDGFRLHGLFMREAVGFEISGVDVHNATGYANIAMGVIGSPDVTSSGTYENCFAYNSNVSFEQMASNGVTLTDCHARDGDGDIGTEAYFHPLVGSKNITYIDCTGYGEAYGGFSLLSISHNGTPLENIRIINCDIEVFRRDAGSALTASGALPILNLEIIDSSFVSHSRIGARLAGVEGTATNSYFQGATMAISLGASGNGTPPHFTFVESHALGLQDPAGKAAAFGVTSAAGTVIWEGGTIEARGPVAYALGSSNISVSATTELIAGNHSAILRYTENDEANAIAPGFVLGDPSVDFAGASLRVVYLAWGAPSDQLLFAEAGGIGLDGNQILFEGVVIGTFSGGQNGTGLEAQFNEAVTAAAVEALVRSIAFSNGSEWPDTRSRLLEMTISNDLGLILSGNGAVIVTGVNDSPVLDVAATEVDLGAEGAIVFSAANGNGIAVAEVDNASVTVTLEVANGVLTLAGTDGLSFLAGADRSSSLTVSGTAAAVSAALDGLSYMRNADHQGSDRLIVEVDDGSGAANAISANAISIQVLRSGTADNDVISGEASADAIRAGEGDDRLTGHEGADTLDGGGGIDTVDYSLESGSSAGVHVNLSSISVEVPGSSDPLGPSRAYDSHGATDLLVGIENVKAGAGADTIFGNDGANEIDGGVGGDLMAGGGGNDLYFVDDSADVVVELDGPGSGIDEVRASIGNHVLAANVENLTGTSSVGQTLSGNALANVIIGTSGHDRLFGDDGDDTLIGGNGVDTLDGGLGADSMAGGASNDIYYVDSSGDTVIEAAGGGSDVVNTTLLEYSLPSEVENLSYVGVPSSSFTGFGNELDNRILGSSGDDMISGLDGNDSLLGSNGNDTLDGGIGADSLNGGSGADRMVGGAGDDIYYVNDAGDDVVELADEGFDTVYATHSSYELTANVERLIFAGRGNFTGTGNALDNMIIGGSGADRLMGGDGNDQLDGGVGADTLAGGRGNDLYLVDDSGDMVVEESDAGSGVDEVRTALASYVLAANVETLIGTSSVGQALTGNALANVITGTSGHDRLFGGDGDDIIDGGAGSDILTGDGGADTLTGGTGNDTYHVSESGDTVVELAAEGTDTVYARLSSYSLGENVEQLIFTGVGDFAGTGNSLSNTIIGGGGADILSGGDGNDYLNSSAGDDRLFGGAGDDVFIGSAGADVMEGGAGADLFIFAPLHSRLGDGADRIVDFVSGVDLIDLALIDADSGSAGNQAFAYIGEGAFTGTAGELRYESRNGDTWLSGDINGDGVADFDIILSGPVVPLASDFIL